MSLIFDIETEPLAVDQLKQILPPFEGNRQRPGEFDPKAVKVGNLKDDAKIAQKIEAARQAHADELAGFNAKCKADEAAYWQGAYDKAALAAETGAVCAIGYRNDAGTVVIDHILETPEDAMLRRFWEQFSRCRKSQRPLIGFNSNRFDVPFLARRSWIVGVPVPASITTPTGYLCPTFVDLMDRWQCGDRREWISLNKVCRAMGLGAKPDDCSGSQFHQLLRLEGGHEAAINYLRNDLEMTFNLAVRLGVL